MSAETTDIIAVFCDKHCITCSIANSMNRQEMVKELSTLLHHRNNNTPGTIRSRSLLKAIWDLIIKGATKGNNRHERRCERYRSVAVDWVKLLRAANPAVEIPTQLGLTVQANGTMEWTATEQGSDE